jgi:hypothetical protein
LSGDESESDLLLPRSTRTRRKSGRAATSSVQETPTANVVLEETSRSASPEASEAILNDNPMPEERQPEEDWIKFALNILLDVKSHKSFVKLNIDKEQNSEVVLRPCNVDSMKKGLEEGSIKSVHDFYTHFMLMLVNIVMSNSSESEVRLLVVCRFFTGDELI